jgi:hypothetical protein
MRNIIIFQVRYALEYLEERDERSDSLGRELAQNHAIRITHAAEKVLVSNKYTKPPA